MTESKKLIIPELTQHKEVILDNISNFKLNDIQENSKKAIKMSTYSYGSNGKMWYYLSKLNKK